MKVYLVTDRRSPFIAPCIDIHVFMNEKGVDIFIKETFKNQDDYSVDEKEVIE